MQKIILSLLVCCSNVLFAQKSFFGVNAGTNIANQRLHIDYFYGNPSKFTRFYQNTVKPTFGLFYHYGITEKSGLRLNAQYMSLGYKDQGASITDLEIDYLTFQITYHYSVNKHLSFYAGPNLSFTLGGTKLYGEDITKTYHKNDNAIMIGGEHDLYKNLSIGIGYYIGFKNIYLNDGIYGPAVPSGSTKIGTMKYTNRALQFTLIYKFKKPS